MVSVFFLTVWPIRWRKLKKKKRLHDIPIPSVSKDIPEVTKVVQTSSTMQLTTYEDLVRESSTDDSTTVKGRTNTRMEISPQSQGSECSSDSGCNLDLSWGNWYTLNDLQIATDGFSPSNIIGEGGYAVVYRGRLPDGAMVAIKYLTNKSQAQKEFVVEVETIGRIRHKNLVRLLGYCAEGDERLLIYEYVNNGNLEEWLHGTTSKVQTPSWDARMKILLGTAKGMAYLHESLEPKIIHRDIKASNILLDSCWNAKVADFGLAKFLGSERTHVMTRVMGTFGYVAPEYASTGLLNERSDVYSFGVLLMEVITGRDPVDYSRAPGEVNLVEWLKLMLSTRRLDEVADSRLEEKPSPRALKKALVTALQCVHPDVSKRPSMGHIVHMLEAESFGQPDSWKNVRNSGLTKLLESQKQQQHQLIHEFSKELKSCKLTSYENPRTKRRSAHIYEA